MPSARAMARGWFGWAMLNSIVLLALTSYAMSTLCDSIAAAWGIPDELIGSTVVAIGTSLPNVFAAVAVGRAGKADMAVCQAFGSNAFDVLVAFALPLAVKSAYLGGVPLKVEAPGLSRDVTVDLIFVALFIGLVVLYRGRMRPSFGVCSLLLYLGWFSINMLAIYAHELERILSRHSAP
jgi:Ca2+/Na+ antiporter